MVLLDQPIDFAPLPGHATPTFAARVTAGEWQAFGRAAQAADRRLVALWGSDERDRGTRQFAVHAAYDLAEGLVCLTLPVDADRPQYPGLAEFFPAAGRLQRSLRDLLGVAVQGRDDDNNTDETNDSDSRPWLRHANWPESYHPLRHDAAESRFETNTEDYAFVRVEGDGVHEIAVGPIHAGIIEPGHFRFSVMGENVLRLEERFGYKHKGIERRFAGLGLADGARLAGRVSGDTTVAYAWAYSQAAEAIAGVTVPERAGWLRALWLERERVANHLGDLGYLGNDVALSFGLAQFMRLKEDWVRLNGALFGHRFLMDRIVPGGVAVDLDAAGISALLAQCEATERTVHRLKGIYDDHAGLQDRFLTTGRVTPELARRLGVTGLVGRASDQPWDLRCQHPCAPYDRLGTRMAMQANGDVAARALVRFDELSESFRLIREICAILEKRPTGPLRTDVKSAPDTRGFGWIEGWRGDVFVALETGRDGKLRRAHCHDPSWQNWPALEHAIIDNIVPDFPLINKSFNLSYAGPDL